MHAIMEVTFKSKKKQKTKNNEGGICYQPYHQASKKPKVEDAICNTFKGEWAHIHTMSRTTKAHQVSTNVVLVT